MDLPVLLSSKPRAWRTNPLWIPIRCWTDRQRTVPLDLDGYGTSWASQIRESYAGPLVATFTIVPTTTTYQGADVVNGLTLTLSGADTAALTSSVYVFDVEVTGGVRSPLTVFLGSFIVDGEVTRSA